MTPSTISINFNLAKYAPKTISGLGLVGATPGVGDSWVELHPDVQMGLEIVASIPLNYFQQLLFGIICSKDNLWPCPCWGSPWGWGWLGWTSDLVY